MANIHTGQFYEDGSELILTDQAQAFLRAMEIASKRVPQEEMPAFCLGINAGLESAGQFFNQAQGNE